MSWARLSASLLAIAACGTPGELTPFGSGAVGGGDGGGTIAGGGATVDTVTDGEGDGGTATGGTTLPPGELEVAYVRCARTTAPLELSGEVIVGGAAVTASTTLRHLDVYDTLPGVGQYLGGFVAPCDLMLRRADGSDEVLYACQGATNVHGVCAALDPAVSPDGTRIAFSVFRGPIEHRAERPSPVVLDPNADGGDLAFVDLPNPQLAAVEAQLHIVDVASGEVTALPHTAGVFDTAPAFLGNGRLVFTSTRDAIMGTMVRFLGDPWDNSAPAPLVPQLFVMDPAGRDIQRLSAHGLSGEFYPFPLADGRIAHGGRQLFGMLPYRYTNGSPGAAGATTGTIHLFALGPDGTLLTPLFGSHTHLNGAPTHVASHRIGQTSDGTLWFTEGGGTASAGNIHGFFPRTDFVEGPGPTDAPPLVDLFRPEDFAVGTRWSGSGNGLAAPTPAPAVMLPGYADPLVYRGFVRDPEGLPDGGLMLTWAKGGCSSLATVDPELFGDPEPPSGSGGFSAANLFQVLGKDTPGCDAGIYRMTAFPSEHPSDLVVMIDSVAYHEIMPRAFVPYRAVHGVDHPATTRTVADEDPSAAIDDRASPFGVLQISSLLDRQTRSLSGHPFGSLIAWALQGTDTGDYDDDEICGLRVLAVQPNMQEEQARLRAPAGHRTLILGEVAARKRDAQGATRIDDSGAEDTSLNVQVPADVPLLLQAIDCDGRTLNTSQTPISVRPGEVERCHGCHQRSEAALPLAHTAVGMDLVAPTLLGTGSVPLLAGGSATQVATTEREGWGWTIEFERDVLPILQMRCTPCHDGATAQAGLVLDTAGQDAGSTWWQVVADTSQAFVPADRRAPAVAGASLTKPQLTRYVRFMDARGSLLYWKAANRRTDGRTDATFPDDAPDGFADVDFGADHPTAITDEELAVLGRWIDTGAGIGEALRLDTTAPTLAVSVELGNGASTLSVGTVDVGAGIDPPSLSACLTNPAGGCELVPISPAAKAGIVTTQVPSQDVERELRVEVSDRAGNTTIVQRTLGTLAGADLATDAQGDGDGGATGGTASGDGTAGSAGGSGDGGGRGCRVGDGPRAAWFALLVLLCVRRRTGTRVRLGRARPGFHATPCRSRRACGRRRNLAFPSDAA